MSLLPMIGLTAASDWCDIAYYNVMDGLEVNVYRKLFIVVESYNILGLVVDDDGWLCLFCLVVLL